MYNVFLNKEAKKDLKKHNLDEKVIIDSIQEEYEDANLSEIQDILLVAKINNKILLITGEKNKTTITVTNIVSNVIAV